MSGINNETKDDPTSEMPGKPKDDPIPKKPDGGAEGVVNNDPNTGPKKTFDPNTLEALKGIRQRVEKIKP